MQRKKLRGGYLFRNFAGQPEQRVVPLDIPSTVSIPISELPAVQEGDDIVVGTPLTSVDGSGRRFHPVVSSVAGRVLGVQSGRIRVATSGSQDWIPASGSSSEWENLSPETIEAVLLETGSTAVCSAGIPTRQQTGELAPESVRHVIIHHPQADVFVSPLESILGDRGGAEIAAGVAILKRLMPGADFHLVLGQEEASLLEKAVSAAASHGIELFAHTGNTKYPQYHEAVLFQTVTGQAVPEGKTAVDVGALVLDIAGLLQVVDAVTRGKPYIERVVGLAGPALQETVHVVARFGTPVSHLVAAYVDPEKGARFIQNSAMTGREIEDPEEPLSPECRMLVALPKGEEGILPFMSGGLHKDSITGTFLSALFPSKRTADTNVHGDERPCVSCTYCEQVCPVGILPYHLHRYVQRGIIDENLVRYGVFRCIDCNLCTYVCPSKIPLARLMVEGKTKLLEAGYLPVGRSPAADPQHVRSEGDDQ